MNVCFYHNRKKNLSNGTLKIETIWIFFWRRKRRVFIRRKIFTISFFLIPNIFFYYLWDYHWNSITRKKKFWMNFTWMEGRGRIKMRFNIKQQHNGKKKKNFSHRTWKYYDWGPPRSTFRSGNINLKLINR